MSRKEAASFVVKISFSIIGKIFHFKKKPAGQRGIESIAI
jgi:hypothetical protein